MAPAPTDRALAASPTPTESPALPIAQRMPPELLAAIFQHCSVANTTRRRSAPPIARVALVCRAWLEPARRVLYSRPCLYRALDGDTRFEALALTLKAQPTLAELVDELEITSVYTCPSPSFLYAVQQTVALATNLVRVTIDAEMATSDAVSSLSASSVRDLRFADPQRQAAFGNLTIALGAASNATRLYVSGYRSGRGSGPCQVTPIATQAWHSVSLLQISSTSCDLREAGSPHQCLMSASDLRKLTSGASHTLQHLALDLLYPRLGAELFGCLTSMIGLCRLELSAVSESRRPSPHDFDAALPVLAHALDTLCARQLRHLTLGDVFATSVVLDAIVASDARLRLHTLRLIAVPQPMGMIQRADADCQLRGPAVIAFINHCRRTEPLQRIILPQDMLRVWGVQEHRDVHATMRSHGAKYTYDPARRLK